MGRRPFVKKSGSEPEISDNTPCSMCDRNPLCNNWHRCHAFLLWIARTKALFYEVPYPPHIADRLPREELDR